MNSPASSKNASITAAILAGGQGRRFGGLDKGIQPLFGKPVVSFVVDALRPHCETIVICANRHHDEYAQFVKVLPDDFQGFRGPLAGTRPPHHGFDGLMGVTQLAAQSRRDRLSVAYAAPTLAVSLWKSLALFRQHVSASPI